MVNSAGFPIVSSINKYRQEMHYKSHNSDAFGHAPLSLQERVNNWMGHKLLSVISFPANAVAVGVGIVGMTATACTLGAFKVAVFAATLGNVKRRFSIGFIWLGDRTFTSLFNILSNVWEIMYDVGVLVHEGYKKVKMILIACKLEYIITLIKEFGRFIGNRFETGALLANFDEKSIPSVKTLPGALGRLNRATQARSCYSDNQPMKRWFEHKLLSVLNIPANAALACLSGIAACAGAVCVIAKTTLYALTNIHVPLPTGINRTCSLWLLSSVNTARNSVEVVADGAILIYRIADAVRLTKVVATVADILAYIPRAVCT